MLMATFERGELRNKDHGEDKPQNCAETCTWPDVPTVQKLRKSDQIEPVVSTLRRNVSIM